MSKLITKARAGVTLVELLVVILIVTILSVSMLPLLQPFVVEAQYAAEAIPVIGNIRTKVGIYQYDKGKLPSFADNTIDTTTGQDTGKIFGNCQIESWILTDASGNTSFTDPSTVDVFCPVHADIPTSIDNPPSFSTGMLDADSPEELLKHLQIRCDIDYQDLKGKRSKPNNYQYLVMRNGTAYAYFVGCFGDGNGLKMGTGYAVCEIVADGHKYLGTWKRYKPVSNDSGDDTPVFFTTDPATPTGSTKTIGCFVPDKDTLETALGSGENRHSYIDTMVGYGWEF